MSEKETHPATSTSNKKFSCCLWVFCLTLGLATVFLVVLFPGVQAAREAARKMQCLGNNKGIILALHNYHDKYKTLPPAYTVDADGNRLHSWRVLILPFLEQQQLYDNIRLDEPWDSEYNRQFHSHRPHQLCCPSNPEYDDLRVPNGKRAVYTNYMRIVGEGTTTTGSDTVSFSEVKCGTSFVLMVVETTRSVCWMAPEDLTLEELAIPIPPRPGKADRIGPDSWHPKFINGSLADGSCIYFSREVPPEALCEAAMIQGVKTFDIRDYTE